MTGAEDGAEDALTGRKILLVDDEPDILDSLQALLESSLPGLQVHTAQSGMEAVKLLEAGGYAAMITDYKMPGMDGMELLRNARDMAPNMARLLMTAFPDLQIAIEAINDARIENFLTKPLNPAEVVAVTRAVLEKRRSETYRNRAFARAMDELRREKKGDPGGAP